MTRFQKTFRLLSWLLISLGFLVLGINYAPVVYHQTRYIINSGNFDNLIPVDTNLGIVIDKIGANASIVENVDPFDSQAYQQALTKGVAHANGTPLPGERGISFLFSHSSASILMANTYNSVFFLLSKLDVGDVIFIYRDGVKTQFTVEKIQIVNSNQVEYLNQDADEPKLILMTCWPPGTDFKRLLVFATKTPL